MGFGSFSGGGLGMGIAFTLYDEFSQTAGEIERSMQGLGMTTDMMTSRIDTSMNQMLVGAGLLGVGLAALVPVGFGIRTAAEFEQARVGLQTFLHTKEAADEAFKNIQVDAKLSATFDTQGLLGANRALISAGLSAQQARIDTNALANAIAAVGGGNPELQRMAVNLQGIKGNGTATGMDLKQFGILGINIYKLLGDATGKTEQETRQLKLTYDDVTLALRHAAEAGGMYAGAAEAQANTINGKLSNIGDSIKFFLAGIGDAVHDSFGMVLDTLQSILTSLAAFINTPFGKWLVQVTTYMSIFLVVLGTVLLVSGFARFSIYKLAGAFGDLTKAEILSTIANEGMVAGLWSMAVATWAALWPILLIVVAIAALIYAFVKLHDMIGSTDSRTRFFGYTLLFIMGPIGWLVGGIMAINQGLKDFDGFLDGTTAKLTGIAGFFQRLGGIIRGVSEIFSTYNSDTNEFSLSLKLEEALRKMGVLDTVIALGTWIARLMSFVKGFKEGFVSAFKTVKGWIVDVIDSFRPIEKVVDGIGFNIAKSQQSMEKWHDAGVLLGKAFIVIFIELALVLTVAAIAALVFLAAMVLSMAIPLGIAYLLYKAISWIIDKFREFKAEGSSTFVAILETLLYSLFMFITFIPRMLWSIGKTIVSSMIEGIKAYWPVLVEFLKNALMAINPMFGAMFKVADWAFGSHDGTPKDGGTPGSALPTMQRDNNLARQDGLATNRVMMNTNNYNNVNGGGNSKGGPSQIVIPVHIGNELLDTHIINVHEQKAVREQ